jgi:AraC-like DNA-binding protein
LLFHTTRQAFAADGFEQARAAPDHPGARAEMARLLVDRHLTETRLTPRWLAKRLGVSLRTLQEDFSARGVTVTSLIRDRRLRLARDRLLETRRGVESGTIAEIAYASGFNDISYFNRCFRKAFACSPRDAGRKGR